MAQSIPIQHPRWKDNLKGYFNKINYTKYLHIGTLFTLEINKRITPTSCQESLQFMYTLIFIFTHLHISNYRLQIADYRLKIADYRLQTTDYRLQITDYRLFTMAGCKKKWIVAKEM